MVSFSGRTKGTPTERADTAKSTGSRSEDFLLEELTWCEAADAIRSRLTVALLPLGSTEAHGPHLPLCTDSMISREMVHRATWRLREKGISALILPPLCYGVSDFASPFAGTISLSETTLVSLVRDICLRALEMGFLTICLCTAHLEPAQFEALHKVKALIKEKTGATIGIPDNREAEWAARLGEEFNKGARHAGAYETSMVMTRRGDMVREAIRHGLAPVWIDLPARVRSGARSFKEAGAGMAYFGDPARASTKEGEIYLDVLASMIVSKVERLIQENPI